LTPPDIISWRGKNELHIDFTLEHNELLKGVSRVRSLDIILEIGKVEASQEDKKQMADSEK
jgi:beta-phosphoglucomutase